MTTSDSPALSLRFQAESAAAMLKKVERGEVSQPFANMLENARQRGTLKFGVVMDDKVIAIEMAWSVIKETSEEGLVEYILKLMQGYDAVH